MTIKFSFPPRVFFLIAILSLILLINHTKKLFAKNSIHKPRRKCNYNGNPHVISLCNFLCFCAFILDYYLQKTNLYNIQIIMIICFNRILHSICLFHFIWSHFFCFYAYKSYRHLPNYKDRIQVNLLLKNITKIMFWSFL